VAVGGVQAEGSFAPAFTGQRPPFGPGHEVSVTHGANSERRLGPLAEAFVAALMADEATPDYLREPSYRWAVQAWGRAEAIVMLLSDWLSGMDVETALTEVTTSEESEERSKGGLKARRQMTSRRVASVVDQLHRHEVRAMQLRARLGLDPLSRARLGKDVASQQLDLARLWAEEDRAAKDAADGGGDDRDGA
jgi:hypothetical protein